MARKPKKQGPGWLTQVRQAYQVTRRADPRVGLVVLGLFLAVFAAFVGIGLLIGHPIYLGIVGFPIALLAATVLFGRRAERAAFIQIEGQPGAAAAVLQSLRRGWTVTPAIAASKSQDIVHRAVGRPGIVLVGEGSSGRVGGLLATERRRLSRFVPETPVYDITVGDREGQVPLRKLRTHVMKLPRNLRGAEVTELNNRLRALPSHHIPIPKGPLPRNLKLPKGPKTR